jgi:phage/plasmid-associated DNA primase
MNADTITTSRLADLKAILQAAVDTVLRLHLLSVNGDITTRDAAEVVNATAETIANFCKD